MTYEEAKRIALNLKMDDVWIIEKEEEFDIVIGQGCAYNNSTDSGWIPRAHITLKPEIVEMFTGVVPSAK